MINFRETDWLRLLKKWWVSILLLPFIFYSIHQAYWVLRFNIFFAISYSFPFPINIEYFITKNTLLLVHEAGHAFFMFFGRTWYILGGSLYEVLLPMVILGYLIYKQMVYSSQVMAYITGSAWMSVAFYAADGANRQLPLIGNLGKEAHDWYNLLSGWGMLDKAQSFGVTFAVIGGLFFLLALTLPRLMRKYDYVSLDLKL
jgi:hypothetical protein